MNNFIFYILAVIAVISALGVVISKDPLKSALWLIASFMGIAGEYILLHAEFIAMLQIMIYVGAIAVMIIISMMIMDRSVIKGIDRFNPQPIWALALGFGILIDLLILAYKFKINVSNAGKNLTLHGNNIAMIGKVLFKSYLIPFEITAIILLLALIGAVYLTKERL